MEEPTKVAKGTIGEMIEDILGVMSEGLIRGISHRNLGRIVLDFLERNFWNAICLIFWRNRRKFSTKVPRVSFIRIHKEMYEDISLEGFLGEPI